MPIPFRSLETVFLDAGNTLLSMDYDWISRELAARGIEADAERVRRAEAAARPIVSRALTSEVSAEGSSIFAVYLHAMLSKLGSPGDLAGVAEELVLVLRGPGRERLWSSVLPRVPEALAALRGHGLRLVAVSNSDGSVENVLTLQGLRGYLDAVFDSHWVGFEKPDRRIFLHALESTGSRPETTLHVGDLYSADVQGARGAGLHTALLDPFGDWDGVDCPRYSDLWSLAEAFGAPHRAP